MKTRIFIFIGVLALIAFAVWLGGYNFDTRSPDVALAFLGSIVMSAIVAAVPLDL